MKSINMNVFWMTAEEALAKLGTKPQTLYANVSRGRIRAKPDPADPRRSRYHSDDVLRLAERHSGRRQADVVAAQAIRWGDPILSTSISRIAEGRLFYRGFEASDLSASATLEDIAKLLWQVPSADVSGGKAELQHLSRLTVAMRSLADRVTEDPPSIDRTPEALRVEAADVLSTVAAGLAPSPDQMPLHQRLAIGWRRPEAEEPIASLWFWPPSTNSTSRPSPPVLRHLRGHHCLRRHFPGSSRLPDRGTAEHGSALWTLFDRRVWSVHARRCSVQCRSKVPCAHLATRFIRAAIHALKSF